LDQHPILNTHLPLCNREAGERASLFNLTNSRIPAEFSELLALAVQRANSLVRDEGFLKVIEAKQTWTYAPGASGAEIASVFRTRLRPGTREVVRPKIAFYTPPAIGRDVCGGWSWGPLYRTKADGCYKNGTVYASVAAVPKDPIALAGFLLHEWLHAADYVHGDNFDQCQVEKRNSVPIYINCISQAYPDTDAIAACALACP
jgi:hypothetical protein